jgi:hypothetical protein
VENNIRMDAGYPGGLEVPLDVNQRVWHGRRGGGPPDRE